MKIHFVGYNLDLLQQLVIKSNHFIFLFRIATVQTVQWKIDISFSGQKPETFWWALAPVLVCIHYIFRIRSCSRHRVRFKLYCFCSGLLRCTNFFKKSQYSVSFYWRRFFVVFLTTAMVTLSKVISACKVVLLCCQCYVKLPLWNFLWRHRSNITLIVSFWAGLKKIC